MALPGHIIGSETEYGISLLGEGDFDAVTNSILLVNSHQTTANVIWDYEEENPYADARGFQVEEQFEVPSYADNVQINKMLINGARLYVDHAHPEFSTPECSSVIELITYEKAGERIIDNCRRNANATLPPGRALIIYRNNSDQKGNSYGYHENYLMDRRAPFKLIVEHIIPFLVTRQIFCGAGKAMAENNAPTCDFQISQRADFFEVEVGLDTMNKRAIVNTRDEPHADREKYRRLHLIVGDSNMAEVATFLKWGTTLLVLKMIEDNVFLPNLAIRKPVAAMKQVSRDLSLRQPLEMEDGQRMTALEIQREYLDQARQYIARKPQGDELEACCDRWEAALDALAREPDELIGQLDWVTKRFLLRSYQEKKGVAWGDPRIAMMDLQYHDMREDRGLYHLLERQGRVERLTTDEDIEDAMHKPPEGTRAYFRGQCLMRYREEVYGVNWASISFNLGGTEPIKRIIMAEPLRGTRAHVEGLLNASGSAHDLVKNITQ
ncbi:MAG: depupylase/deamidase Dop [bacterium]|nr:depupylase/deamidase Dop [bacterium]